jgi:hypothetical protein
VDRLIGWVDRLPGPAWAWYAAATLAAVLVAQSMLWINGTVPVGQLDATQAYYGALLVALVWVPHLLDRVAQASLGAFRPAAAIDARDLERLSYELTVIPARPVLLITIGSVIITPLYYLADPVGTRTADLSPIALVIRTAVEATTTALFLTLGYHTLRQLRAVDRIHRLASRVDLLRPAPLYAFSRLTSLTAAAIALLLLSSILADPKAWQEVSPWLMAPWLVGFGVIAVAAFWLPLRGVHDRMTAEKHRLQDAVGQRIAATLEEIHAMVDQQDLARADGLSKALASLITERDLVNRLPTWPWQPGTLGALASAFVLPIILWLVTRFLGQVV